MTAFNFNENLSKLEARHKVYIKLYDRAPNREAREALALELYTIHNAILFNKLHIKGN